MRQFEILNEIAQVAFIVSDGQYDEWVLEVDVDPIGGWTEQRCWQTKGGKVEQLSLFGISDPDVMTLSFELHEEVKKHTGGNLKGYVMKIGEDGEAKVDLKYHEIAEE